MKYKFRYLSHFSAHARKTSLAFPKLDSMWENKIIIKQTIVYVF